MAHTKVGIREFRENLSSYLESRTTGAITPHGSTIGFYLPVKPLPTDADIEALRLAGEKIREMVAAASVTEDDLVEGFEQLRRQRRRHTAWFLTRTS